MTYTCEDCGKELLTIEDEISYFSNSRCAKCETIYLTTLEEEDEMIRLAPITSHVFAF